VRSELLLVVVAAASAVAASPAPSLKVEISVDQRAASGKDCFSVDTVFTNTGQTDQEIIVWTNYAWSWTSATRDVGFNISALKNEPFHKVLKPNQQYRSPLYVCREHEGKRPTTLRLGFVPRAVGPVSGGVVDIAKSGGIFWSNAVTAN
jgi:hypothetical protein